MTPLLLSSFPEHSIVSLHHAEKKKDDGTGHYAKAITLADKRHQIPQTARADSLALAQFRRQGASCSGSGKKGKLSQHLPGSSEGDQVHPEL